MYTGVCIYAYVVAGVSIIATMVVSLFLVSRNHGMHSAFSCCLQRAIVQHFEYSNHDL